MSLASVSTPRQRRLSQHIILVDIPDSGNYGCLERRKPESVTSVLHAEDAQQEAVHEEKNSTPEEDGKLLGPYVGNARRFESKRYRRKRQDTI